MFPSSASTSGTYLFNPSLGEATMNAFSRIQIRPTEITQSHLFQAKMSANLLLSEWSNQQPNLWEVGLQTLALVSGTASYTVSANTVMILDLYVRYGDPSTDRYLMPVSRTEYASFPDKDNEAFPNVYWYDRTISQTVTFYPVPDDNGPYTAYYYSVRQTQDIDYTSGQNPEVPYRFYDAYCAGLAWKLSEHYAPQLEDKMFTRYQRAWSIATAQDTENVELYITPGLSGYFR